MQANVIPNLLPLDIEEVDFHISIHYRIESKQTLIERLKEETISLDEYFHLLLKLTFILLGSSNYMLNEERYVINEQFIYVGNTVDDLFLVYLPLKEIPVKKSVREELSQMAANLIKYVSGHKGERYQRMMSYLDEPDFSIQYFKELLIELISVPQPSNPSEAIPGSHAAVVHQSPNGKKTTKTVNKRQKIMMTWSGVILILLSWVAYAKYQSDLMLYIAAGVSVVGILVILLGLRSGKAEIQVEMAEMREEVPIVISPKRPQEFPQPPCNPVPRGDTALLYNNVSVQGAEPTALIREMKKATLVFSSGKKVMMDGERLVIGRNPDAVDFVVNTIGVSRAHLELVMLNNGTYGIKDLGSSNGSSLNGIKMEANKVYKLQENDMVKFAREEFIFKMG